jgi:tRNA nucleotidyltransferase (CCA-adding enzyme)
MTQPNPNLLTKLATAISPATYALVMHIAQEAEQMGYKAYLVGGPVRDMVLAQPVNDIDLVFEGAAIPLARHLARTLGGYALTHDRFGTAKWSLDDPDAPPTHPLTQAEGLPSFIDLITARRETYEHPAALPTVTFAGIQEDLFRRDFVINTLALQLNGKAAGKLLDPYGGLSDLREGRIRILHDASFIEDPTRIFRALRFEQRLNFLLDPHTRHLLQSAVPLIALLSPDRVRHEVVLLLDEANALAMLEKMARWGMMPYVFPGVEWTELQAEKLSTLKAAGVTETVLLLAAVVWGASVEVVQGVAERLGLPKEQRDLLLTMAEIQNDPMLTQPTLANSEIYFRLRKENGQAIEWVAQLTDHPIVRTRLRRYLDDLLHRPIPITGDDLKALGIPPGKQYQVILDKVRAAVMDDVILPTNPTLLLTALNIP